VELKERTFEPELIVSPGKEKVVEQLKKAAAKADEIYLAPDPDREGEAIAYHLAIQLGTNAKERKKIHRVTFNEITKKAVQEAFKHARDIDQNLVAAQQTRRVLDRPGGLPDFAAALDKVRRGLSRGACRLLRYGSSLEREREIRAFQPVEYWTLEALLHPEKQSDQKFKAKFHRHWRRASARGQTARTRTARSSSSRGALPDKNSMDAVLAALEKGGLVDQPVCRRANSSAGRWRRSSPANCNVTLPTSWVSTCAATMGVAQRLYEGVDIGDEGTTGLITYMRTDFARA